MRALVTQGTGKVGHSSGRPPGFYTHGLTMSGHLFYRCNEHTEDNQIRVVNFLLPRGSCVYSGKEECWLRKPWDQDVEKHQHSDLGIHQQG